MYLTSESWENSFNLHKTGIGFSDNFLDCCGYKYITRFIHKIFTFVRFSTREAHDSTILYTIIFQLL